MEKPPKPRNKFLRFLIPHAASASALQSPPVSPRKSPGKAVPARGTSGPLISIIPPELRRRPKTASFDAREPTSPKVSCMGQIKNARKIKRKPKRISYPKKAEEEKKRQETPKVDPKGPKQSPSLGHIKQFSSARGALSDFDWRTHGGAAVAPDRQDGYTSNPD